MELGSGRHASRAGMKVLFMPDWAKENPYQDLLARELREIGVDVSLANYPDGWFPLNRSIRKFGPLAAIHLHWITPLIAPILWSMNPLARSAKLALLLLDVLLVRMRGIKVIWTVHNLVAHESPDKKLEIGVRRWLAISCSRLIIHSTHALQRIEAAYERNLSCRSTVIPHGNYDGCYPCSEVRQQTLAGQLNPDGHRLVVLFFGAIRPYKGVQTLIRAFRAAHAPNLHLVVAGRPISPVLAQEITGLAAGNPRITLMLDYVPTEDVAPLFAAADVVALPLDEALTSGSVVLSMTMGRSVLLPEEERALDIVDDQCADFFSSETHLTEKLESLSKDVLRAKGVAARQAADTLRWKDIATRTRGTYGTRHGASLGEHSQWGPLAIATGKPLRADEGNETSPAGAPPNNLGRRNG